MYASQKTEECFANDNYTGRVCISKFLFLHTFYSPSCVWYVYLLCVCMCVHSCACGCVCVFMGKCVIMNMWGQGEVSGVGFLFHRFERESLSWFRAAYFSLAGLQASGFSLSAFYLTVWIWDCRYGLLCLALCGFWEFEPTSSCLESKNFSH